jgi:indole-3-glycerol phosphate synthase
MRTYLDDILATHRAAAAADRRDPGELRAAAAGCGPARGFAGAIARASGGVAVIAEIKRRSPSKGVLGGELDPAATAASYAAGGATCLSVLTDGQYFGGSAEDLRAARAAVELPALRKDFTVCAADVYDARLMGADAVLLIAAALDDEELRHLHAEAAALGLDVLVEIHDERELARAVAVGATLIGVNQRDLVTFEVETDRAVRVASAFPDTVLSVAESGIRGPDDVRRLAEAGYHAVLVGESVVTASDRAGAVAALRAAGARGKRGPAPGERASGERASGSRRR